MNLDSLALKFLLVGGAIVASTSFACGEDAPDTSDDKSNAKDGDKPKRDAGRDGGKRDARADEAEDDDDDADDDDDDDDDDAECTNRQSRSCDDCDEASCVQTCSNGEWGACRAAVVDAGSRPSDVGPVAVVDGSVRAVDGGVSVALGDASVTLPTAECPATFMCSKGMGVAGMLVGMALGGASYCAGSDAIGLPPTCMAADDCTKLGFTSAMCYPLPAVGSYCIQFCQ